MNLLPNIPKIDNHQIDRKSLFFKLKTELRIKRKKRKRSDKESEARVIMRERIKVERRTRKRETEREISRTVTGIHGTYICNGSSEDGAL